MHDVSTGKSPQQHHPPYPLHHQLRHPVGAWSPGFLGYVPCHLAPLQQAPLPHCNRARHLPQRHLEQTRPGQVLLKCGLDIVELVISLSVT